MADIVNLIVIAFAQLAALTFVFGDNPWYKVAERLMVGVTIGYSLVIGLNTIINLCWNPMIGGKWIYLIPFILGFASYGQLFKKTTWLVRYPLVIITGTNVGLVIVGTISAMLINQLTATFNLSIITSDPFINISNLIILIGTFFSIAHFLFLKSLDVGLVKKARNIGRYFLIIALGSAWASTSVYRQELLIGTYSILFASPEAKLVSLSVAALIGVSMYIFWKKGYVSKT